VTAVTERGGRVQIYLDIFVRRRWVIIGTTLVTWAVVTVGTFMIPATYSASATLRVAQAYSGSIEYADYMYAERLMNTYLEILRSRPVLEETIQRLGLGVESKVLSTQLKAEVVPETELIRITVEDGNPRRARDIANTLGALLLEQSQSLYRGGSKSAREILEEQIAVIDSNLEQDRASLETLMDRPGRTEAEVDTLSDKIALEEETYARMLSQYEQARVEEAMRANSITIVEAAIEPQAPSSPNKPLNMILGALLGLSGGTGLAFLLENLGPAFGVRRLSSLRKSEQRKASGEEGREPIPASIDELGLPAQITTILKGTDIDSAEDLLNKDDQELLAISGLGPKSLERVRTALKDKGFI
jgi:capsular polysaccharide biosynthesis protein